MLTGKIARPQALDHYEECKAMVEKLEEQVRVLKRVADAAMRANYQHAETCYCDIKNSTGEYNPCECGVKELDDALAATEGLDNGGTQL
jgi:hypothetical protein